MTVYILGGSSTVMVGGWADSFTTQMVRRHSVRNLAIGAGNTLMSLVRLKQEVTLTADDVVVWASSIRDVMCLSAGGYRDGGLLRYTEEVIRHVAGAGARFIPLLMDTWKQDMDLHQPAYKQALLRLLSHYELDWIDVTSEFVREAGVPRVPLTFYDATGHIAAGSEMTHFVADLTREAIARGRGVPHMATPLHVDPDRPVQIISTFDPPDLAEGFESRLLKTTLWQPGLALPPALRPEGALDVEALVVMADPEAGAFDLCTPDTTVTLSACCAVDYYKGPMLMTAYLPNLVDAPLRVAADDLLRLDWARGSAPARADLLFHAHPAQVPSRARLASMVVRSAT